MPPQTPTGSAAQALPSAASSSAPIVMRQTTFQIPFTVKQNAPVPKEIQLHISTDRGGSWKMYDRASPDAKQFSFRAATDGEYWFSLRTIEADGRQNPPGPALRPGMRVVVDTAEPKFDFDATVGPSGEVKANWRATDPSLATDTLKIEYQPAGGGTWQPIAIDRRSDPASPASTAGQLTWWPDTNSRVIHVRAEISDRAGNKAVMNRRLFLTKVGGGNNAANSAVAGAPGSVQQGAARTEEGIAWAPGSQSANAGVPAVTGGVSQWLASSGRNRAPQSGGTGGTPVENPYVQSSKPLTDLGSYPSVESQTQPRVTRQVTTGINSDPAPAPKGNNTAAGNSTPAGNGTPAKNEQAPARPQMTNKNKFQLDYDVDAVGPSGIAEVQLWGTNDQGQTWTKWQTDADKQSPMDISVPKEGNFGFRIVVIGNNGLSGHPPQNGEPADLCVGVDTTAPTVRLTSAIYGEGEHAGQLDIRWEATDASLGERPVTLQFSENHDGPWSTIASGIPNTGQYYWQVESRIPAKIFLRIEVRDEAGNMGEFQVAEPVNTSGLVPQAHIKGLRSASRPDPANAIRRLPR